MFSHSVVLTLCDPMDCSPQGSSVHGILQTRVLEWGVIAFSLSRAELLIFNEVQFISSFFPVVSKLLLLYDTIDKTSRLKMKSLSTVRDTQRVTWRREEGGGS